MTETKHEEHLEEIELSSEANTTLQADVNKVSTTTTLADTRAISKHTPDDRLSRGAVMALLAISMAIFAMALDFTALSVALPKMQDELGVNVSTIQWVINAYAIVIGVLIVTGGRLADMFGRRRVFLLSSGVFALFSLLAGVAQDAGLLIASRAAMGIGGAVMWPAALGMTYAILPRSKAGLAGGLIIGVAGLGNAFGPILGGAMTDLLSWRGVFIINLPIALFTCIVVLRKVQADRTTSTDERIDYAGIVTFSIGIVALLLALAEVDGRGWSDPYIIGLFSLTVVALLGFALVERRAGRHGLVPPDVMRNPQFRAACFSVLLISAVFFAALVYVPLFMVNILEFSPLQAGLGMLPWMGVFAFVSFIAGTLYKRLGAKVIISIGAFGLALGPFLLSFLNENSGYAALVPGMVVMGIGIGMFYSSVTTSAVTALDDSRSSLASGVLYMFQIVGGSIGLGVATTVFSSVSSRHLESGAEAEHLGSNHLNLLERVLSGTDSAQQLLQQSPAGKLTELFSAAFTSGLHTVYLAVAGFAFLGFLVAVMFVGNKASAEANNTAQ